MIKTRSWFRKASAAIEYMALIVFLIGSFLLFQKYILRAFWGSWKRTGDVFGFGRQYDPRPFGEDGNGGGTLQCMYVYDDPSDPASAGNWVLQPCYDTCREDPGKSKTDCVTACGQASLGDASKCD